MARLGLLLFPGHVDEGPLDIVVDNLGPTARPLLDLLLVRGVALDAKLDLLKSTLPQHRLGLLAVLDVLEEAVERRAFDGLAVLLAHLRREVLVPVDRVLL